MCEKEYINIKTGEKLDLEKVKSLSENAMLKHRIDLWCEWDFERNSNLLIYNITKGSDRKVWWHCAKCKQQYDSIIHNRVKGVNCPYCSGKRVNHTNSLESLNPELASEWHPTKNSNLTPADVTGGSSKKVWWLGKCGHEWEAFVSDRNKGKSCKYCTHNPKVLRGFNDLNTTHSHIGEMLLNREDGFNYTYGSNKKLNFKCECGNIIIKPISEVIRRGLQCHLCKDGISFGEKVIYNMLLKYKIPFKYDSKTTWSENRRYDFIVNDEIIIEVHGEQHSKETTGYFKDRDLSSEIENDKHKKRLANINGIKNYFEVHVSNRDIKELSSNILKTTLLELLNINNVDWNELSLLSQKSIVLDVCKYYSENDKSTSDIAKMYNLTVSTIIKYLKIGNSLNICEYEPNSTKGKLISKRKAQKAVVQFDLSGNFINKFESVRDALDSLNVGGGGSISSCCKGKLKSCNGYIWRYYSDVGDTKNIDVYRIDASKSIVKLTLDGEFIELFSSTTDTIKKSKANNITKCCKGEYSQSNGFKWMYLSDYENKYGKIIE